ncbi:MAG: hypothetical protein ACRERR_12970 [Moraxellaceae bacterium]
MLLKSLLSIAGDRADSGNVWTYSDTGHRDAVVMDLDDGTCAEVPREIDGDVVVVMSRDLAILKGRPFALQKPLRSRDIVHLLEILDEHFGGAAEAGAARTVSPSAVMHRDERLDAILALLRRKDRHTLLLDFGGAHAYLDVKNQKIFLDKEFPFAMVASGGRFSAAEVSSIPAGSYVGISAADFFYEYTLAAKQAGLVDGLSLQARYYIRQWPQFLKSSNTKALIKISAYFSRRKATINAAAQDLLVGMNQIEAYLNAAYVQGLLMVEADSAPVASVRKAAPGTAVSRAAATPSGLFGKIRMKLGL